MVHNQWIMFSTPQNVYETVYKCVGSIVYRNESVICSKYQIHINKRMISLYTLYHKNDTKYEWLTGFFIFKDGTEEHIQNLEVYKSKQIGKYAYDRLGICSLSETILNRVFEEIDDGCDGENEYEGGGDS